MTASIKTDNLEWYWMPFFTALCIFNDYDKLNDNLKRYAELMGIDKPQELEDKKPLG